MGVRPCGSDPQGNSRSPLAAPGHCLLPQCHWPRGGFFRPRGWKEEQGVQARARWPLTFIARGAKNALLGRLRRPPGAWMAYPPCPAGYRRTTSPSPYPLVPERASGESPAPSPPIPRSALRGAGARTVYPPCRARYRTAAPGSYLRHGAGHRDPHLRGARIDATGRGPPSSSAWIYDEPRLTIPVRRA